MGGEFMSELYNRIEKLCKEKEISVTQLCREAKINRSTLTELKKGRTKNLSYTVSKKIADYFKIPLNEVYDGEEPSKLNIKLACHIPNDRQFREAARSLALNLITESTYYIPVYESVSAGFGAYANDYIIDYTPLYIATPEEAQNTIVIVVSGDSMYPKAVVKKYECDINREIVTLVSINPEYAPRVFKGKEIERLRVLGVVKKVIKEL